MSYFEDVYLKRVNKYGNTPQARIYGKMKHDFYDFIEKSPNTILAYYGDNIIKGALQTENTSEKETIDFFLTFKDVIIPNGTVFYHKNRDDENFKDRLMVFNLDKYETIGYNKYQTIAVESKISWISKKDNLLYESYCHLTSKTGGARDKTILGDFKVIDNSLLDSPNRIIYITMPQNDSLNRGDRIIFNKTAWKVVGYDSESINGVMFVTFEEDLTDELTDVNIADENILLNWKIESSLGDNMLIKNGDSIEMRFSAFYNDKISNEPLTIEFLNNSLFEYKNNIFTAKYAGKTTVNVSITNCPQINKTFNITIEQQIADTGEVYLYGPAIVKMDSVTNLNLYYLSPVDQPQLRDFYFESNSGCVNFIKNESTQAYIFVDENNQKYIKIKGVSIGKDKIIMKDRNDSNFNYEKNIRVQSIWM